MTEVKWIKIVTDIFDDEKILLIESLPESDSLIVIWFKLLCLAGKQNNKGVFLMNDKIPYTEEMLAAIFRRPINTVKLALSTFESFGMIEIVNGVITIPNWEKHQNLNKLEIVREQTRKRVAKHRAGQKLLAGITTCAYCGDEATGVDHIIPTSKGGEDTEDNKIPCCIDCNRIKNNQDLEEFLNWNRNRIKDDLVQSNEKLSNFIEYDKESNKYVTRYNGVTYAKVTQTDIDKDIDKDIDIDIDIDIKKKKTTKHKYGEYKHVLLTDDEYGKLEKQYGSSSLQSIITYLDEYLEMKGTKYKSHYMVIKKWGAEAALKKEREKSITFFKNFLES